MKKILSFIIALSLIVPAALFSVGAQREDDEMHVGYHSFGESNGYDICIIDANMHLTTCSEVIGDYLFFSPNMPGNLFHEQLAIYAVKDGEKIYIKDAYEQGLINIDEVARMVSGYNHMDTIIYAVAPLGDVDGNGKLEMADVIEIQKVVAKVKRPSNAFELYDKNKDGIISVADSLAVQKQIAKVV